MKYREMIQDMPKYEFDEEALTVQDLMRETGHGYSYCYQFAQDMVLAKKWERVWKRGRIKPVPAYRPRRNHG